MVLRFYICSVNASFIELYCRVDTRTKILIPYFHIFFQDIVVIYTELNQIFFSFIFFLLGGGGRLWFISVWPLFCSVRVYISLHFLPMILVKLVFHLSVFQFFVFLYLWVLIFSFALCFEFNVFSKLNIVLLGNIRK